MAHLLRQKLVTTIIYCLCSNIAVFAQDTEDFEAWDNNTELISELPEFDPVFEQSDWFFSVGVVAGQAPEYAGSDEYDFSYAPNICIVWRDLLFLRGRKLGVNLIQEDGLKAGLFLRYTGGRKESNPGLDGMGDISRTIASGIFLNYNFEHVKFKSELRQDILSQSHGLVAKVSLSTKIPYEKPLVTARLQTTWGN